MGAIGVWQMVRPLIEDRYFVFAIAAVAAIFAVIFAVFTVQNHKALPKKPKKEKKVAEPKNEGDLPTEPQPVLPLPAPVQEQPPVEGGEPESEKVEETV